MGRIAGSGQGVRRIRASAAVAAFLVDMLLLGGLGASSALAQSSTALYYETETITGTLAIDRLDLLPPGTSTEVVKLGNANVFGIALGGPHIFWLSQAGPHDRGAIMRATLDGRHVRRLVGGLPAPASMIAVRGFLYWSDQNAIGRVALGGRWLEIHSDHGSFQVVADRAHVYWTWGGVAGPPVVRGTSRRQRISSHRAFPERFALPDGARRTRAVGQHTSHFGAVDAVCISATFSQRPRQRRDDD